MKKNNWYLSPLCRLAGRWPSICHANIWRCSNALLPAEGACSATCVCVRVGARACSGPLAGAVGGLLDAVADPGWVAAAVQLHEAPLQAGLSAALAKARVRVDVVVVDAGRRTLPITWHDVHLQEVAMATEQEWLWSTICFTSCEYSYPVYLSLHTSTHKLAYTIEYHISTDDQRTGLLLRQSFFLIVILTVTFWHDFPSSLPVCVKTDSIRLNKANWRRVKQGCELLQVDRTKKKTPKRRKKRWCTSCCWEISLEGWDEAIKRGKSREYKYGRRLSQTNLQWWKV